MVKRSTKKRVDYFDRVVKLILEEIEIPMSLQELSNYLENSFRIKSNRYKIKRSLF